MNGNYDDMNNFNISNNQMMQNPLLNHQLLEMNQHYLVKAFEFQNIDQIEESVKYLYLILAVWKKSAKTSTPY
jgi:hypothetical protein